MEKAVNLNDVSKVIAQDSLEPGNEFYADLSKSRSTRELKLLRAYLENSARNDVPACAAFIGHRGSGKSTELKRLEGDLAGEFTPVHLAVDNSLTQDCDYTDLLLWLVDSIFGHFEKNNLPLDAGKVKAVADWFAEQTVEESEELKKEIELETEASMSSKAGANFGIFAYGLKLLARLKARVVGNQTHRKIARQKLQNYSDELIRRVNELLDHGREVLASSGRPGRILIVQDNLDRLGREAALRLFRDNGFILKQIEADCIWTAPITCNLAPFGIQNLFEHVFTMPTVKVHDRDGKPVSAGIDGLVDLVDKRMDINAVFTRRDVVAYLARMSGGSVRDLLRLLSSAQLAAQVDRKEKMDEDSAKEAVNKLRIDFQGLFVPADAYYPLLASVAKTKLDGVTTASASPEQATNNRAFFAELLVNGSVLEYNGDERWFDVHPVVLEIDAFKNASNAAKRKKPSRK